MDTPSRSQRLGQPSASFYGYAHPMASPVASYPAPQPLVDVSLDEKTDFHQHHPQTPSSQRPYSISGQPSQWHSQYPISSKALSSSPSHNYSRPAYSSSSIPYTRPRGLRIANLLKPWIPIILYAITSLGFVAAISLWKAEVFQGASLTRSLIYCVLSENRD